MLTIIEFLWVEIVNDLLQMYNQRKLRANLFSILSADKLETVFNGIFASANSIHIEQRMQRGEQMEGANHEKRATMVY
mgnify:CR=1 FL=1